MTHDSSKDLLIRVCGIYDVQSYEYVKRVSMMLAAELERAIVKSVGGRMARAGEGCDAVTRLGKWEFAMQANTKNHAGKNADETRCPGKCVQILGRPNPGWISGGEFLERHGVPASELSLLVFDVGEHLQAHQQRRLPV